MSGSTTGTFQRTFEFRHPALLCVQDTLAVGCSLRCTYSKLYSFCALFKYHMIGPDWPKRFIKLLSHLGQVDRTALGACLFASLVDDAMTLRKTVAYQGP